MALKAGEIRIRVNIHHGANPHVHLGAMARIQPLDADTVGNATRIRCLMPFDKLIAAGKVLAFGGRRFAIENAECGMRNAKVVVCECTEETRNAKRETRNQEAV